MKEELFTLFGNKGRIHYEGNGRCVAVVGVAGEDKPVIKHFPFKDMPHWIKELEISSTEHGSIRFGLWSD
jgi:hypothetical protein